MSAPAVDLSVQPASIARDSNCWVHVVVTNIISGPEVGLSLFVDIDGNGSIDPEDGLLSYFELEDGFTNPIPSEVILGDNDATTNGAVVTKISCFGIDSFFHVIGNYVWEVVDGVNTATAPFAVTQPTSTVWIAGEVRDFAPPSNAIPGAIIEIGYYFDARGFAPRVWSGTNGAFRVYVPGGVSTSDVMGVMVTKAGYMSSEQGPNDEPFSVYLFTNCLSQGANILTQALHVVQSVPGQVFTISGHVYVEKDGQTNVLPGAFVQFETDDGDGDGDENGGGIWAFDVSAVDGSFSMPAVGEEAGMPSEIYCDGPELNIRGIAGTFVDVTIYTQDVTGVELFCVMGDALCRAQVTETPGGAPVTGVEVWFDDEEEGLCSAGFTLSNGYYEIAIVAGTNYEAECDEDSVLPLGYMPPASISGLTVTTDTVFVGAPFVLEKAYIISGCIYNQNTNPLGGGRVDVFRSNNWDSISESEINPSGYYEAQGATGEYRLTADDFDGYLGQSYSNHFTWEYDNGPVYDPVTVTTNGAAGIDFYPPEATYIRGTVVGTGAPLPDIEVSAEVGYSRRDQANTDSNGTYELEVPADTNYTVCARSPGESFWMYQYYNAKYDWEDADPVTTAVGAPATNIDFDLVFGMRVEGRVIDEVGQPVSNLWVQAQTQNTNGSYQQAADDATDPNGFYGFAVATNTNYVITVYRPWGAGPNYWYPDMYFSNEYSAALAEKVWTNAGCTVSNVDFRLFPGYRVEGFIYRSDGITPAPNACAEARDAGLNQYDSEAADGGGWYRIFLPTNLPLYVRGSAQDHVAEYYDNAYALSNATTLQPVAMTTARVDFALYSWTEDSDGDALEDYREDTRPDGVYIPGEDVASYTNSDTDADGYNDYQEIVVMGTSATDSNDYLRCVNVFRDGSGVRISWASVSNKIYRVQRNADLATTNWGLYAVIGATGSVTAVSDPGGTTRYSYRVQIQY